MSLKVLLKVLKYSKLHPYSLQQEDPMAHLIFASTSASVTELKKDPMNTVAAGEGFPIAILNRNEPVFYCVPRKAYELLMDKLEDLELNAIADARKGQKKIRVSLNDL